MVFVMFSLYAPIIMYVSAELLAGWLLNYFPLSLFVLWILLLSHVMATIKRKGTCVCKRDNDAVCKDAWGARPQPKHNSYAVKLGVCACCLFSYVIIILLLFYCGIWPVVALMHYLDILDVCSIATSSLENQMTFPFGKLHTFDLFTLASSSSANSEVSFGFLNFSGGWIYIFIILN